MQTQQGNLTQIEARAIADYENNVGGIQDEWIDADAYRRHRAREGKLAAEAAAAKPANLASFEELEGRWSQDWDRGVVNHGDWLDRKTYLGAMRFDQKQADRSAGIVRH